MVAKTDRALAPALALALAAAAATTAALAPVAPARAEVANPYGVAVVIGNRTYRSERVPEVAYAHRDADAFRGYVVEVLGFDPGNVIDLRDASQAQMETAFGNERSHQGKVWRYLHPRHGSDVVVFYSGHGVPGLKDGRGYLLPVDADPDSAEINGYPIDLLYENLGKLAEAKTVRVFLDACFSGDSDRGMLVRSASPVYVQAALPEASAEKLTVLAAASGREVASWDEEARHGLFTRHLLDALYGAGDANGDGRVTAAEAKTWLDDTMTIAARRRFGRLQNASLNGAVGAVLASAGEDGAFPVRASPGDDHGSRTGGAAAAGPDVPAPGEAAPSAPGETAESSEKALGLTFAERVMVQHGLASLGEDVGRADGVFGRRTRGGVRRYQKAKGLAETGYLTAELRDALVAHGEAHAAKLEEEASRRADDAAFAEAKGLNTPESYRSYLDRGGRHEAEARELLAASSKPRWEVGERFRDCADCPELVVVPPGSYEMGSPSWEEGRDDDEGPVHQVTIRAPFAVGVYEVTFREWDACRGAGGCAHDPGDRGWGRGDRPVINVSWNDAKEYVRWLSRTTGKEYRLLSESEWEYVARSGTTGPFHFGATISAERANYDGRYVYGSGRKGRYRGRTVPVGTFPSNGFGLHDGHGNAWEWLEDCWHGGYRGAPSDGSAWTTGGDCGARVMRGGSWYAVPENLRSANRSRLEAGSRNGNLGFRVARALD